MDGYGKLYYQGGKLAYEENWSQDEFYGIFKVYNDNPVALVALLTTQTLTTQKTTGSTMKACYQKTANKVEEG